MKSQWIIEEKVGEGTIGVSKHSSLSRALYSFTRQLTGVKMFYVVIPDGKTMVVYKQDKLLTEGYKAMAEENKELAELTFELQRETVPEWD